MDGSVLFAIVFCSRLSLDVGHQHSGVHLPAFHWSVDRAAVASHRRLIQRGPFGWRLVRAGGRKGGLLIVVRVAGGPLDVVVSAGLKVQHLIATSGHASILARAAARDVVTIAAPATILLAHCRRRCGL